MLKSLAALLFPKTCAGCASTLSGGESIICTTCSHQMPYTQHHEIAENEIFKRFYGRLPLQYASALVYFNKRGIVQQLIHSLKYKGQQDIGTLMGQWYVPYLQQVTVLQTVTDVVPVPLHPKKLRERGYNQVDAFAKTIAQGLNANYNTTTLVRTTYTKTQTKKNLANRASIIGSAFDVAYNETTPTSKHFLLIDDVMTTGATLEACGKAILKIPNSTLSIVTIAYTHI
ncbi:ComF family protein [Flavobacterium litorale]|uniref:ComF family protein n=1 Tax=Flavobacterium litorale TaxID=2856519 RepID=A0ABX8VDY1_9FLAO|nr:ComF family protein [Flavobacterium litorale]QYJ68846.1 ComF family protein [Flavobacterium litorale]